MIRLSSATSVVGREHKLHQAAYAQWPFLFEWRSITLKGYRASVKSCTDFSATRGEAISNSNPPSESNAARLGELDASTSEGTT